ncbi:malto-oligosyltrehalose trehalohydrolase [Pseudoroseicyclus tamaricis]|uniref:Malto-oligosyltrehalose trehalohydrolase n=1 Tax=Pseudoroseicyclus tamaricis TaxID=2705421 RepID=A0A6B2JQM7_9RHOB|nr:malto-oligosyltrehalose trehalohydrolase [Pseudoroseicyclus tamaricis]NDV00330.1 malto-oligosyltrehalose trehalohydrolase [Pseudoroseicyclus tamaricis]
MDDTGRDSYDWGAIPAGEGRWRFRLWAPSEESLTLRLAGRELPMEAEEGGWFSLVAEAEEGDAYQYLLPDGSAVPDPAARRQEGGVHGPSLVTAPRTALPWAGRPWEETVLYELHLGTFTEAGTYRAAIGELDRLAELGITAIEIMPVAQFGGDRGWGYDGVLPYCPHNCYGNPDDLTALIEAAHERGLMVFLDVVYNHFGPDGNYLPSYAGDFFVEGRTTPWGTAIDYTKAPVRRFFIENALYWLEEFGFDGLRLDAVDHIRDTSEPELLIELAEEVHARLGGRKVHLTTEDNRNITYLHERGEDGAVIRHTGEWNDDFHNAAHVLATGEHEGYYADFSDDPLGHVGRCLAEGFAFQGEGGRGVPSAHLPPTAFVDFLQNHDQTGNRALGERLISMTDPERLEALTAILLLSPHIPLLFMGEEYGETRPFTFFAHFGDELDDAVRKGRAEEFAAFEAFTGETVPDPIDEETFLACKLDASRRESAEGRAYAERLRNLLDLRAHRIVPLLAGAAGHAGTLIAAEDGVLAVDWQLDGALLQLRANFADGPRDMPRAEGEVIHETGTPGAPNSSAHMLALIT